MEKITWKDKLTGGAMLKEHRNALAMEVSESAEAQHSARLARAKKKQKEMLAKKAKKEPVLVADNADY